MKSPSPIEAKPISSAPIADIMLLSALLIAGIPTLAPAAPSFSPISGEIERISLNSPGDHWSGGTIVVGGQNVIVPRNLLLDLPANRMTLQQLFAEAPSTCVAASETGLAKGDSCNPSGAGGFATIAANRTNNGNIIAGDIFIEKGREAVTGTVTYINYNDGYFRLNGIQGDSNTGVMVRLNDPDSRHTIQQGAGCASGSPNCSPDPRFTLDGDNYTNVYSNGYPLCIPSTVSREFPGLEVLPGVQTGQTAGPTQAAADGTGDLLCPATNRTIANGNPVDDSRRFAPLMLGDNITAEGNFETVGGVHFLSAHSTMISRSLVTKEQAGQPDYLFLDEVEMDVAGFQNQRARTLIIGYATLARASTGGSADVNIWSVHYDPATNQAHEYPLASVVGCDAAAGPATCGQQGLVGTGSLIFKIRHDVDFAAGAKARLNPCAHLQADPRMGSGICPNGGAQEGVAAAVLADQFGILSPVPREIQARTGHELANPGMVTLDINGQPATHGQYLFPFGMGLGGISTPEFNEINLDALATPVIFAGLPWTLDRRLSPGGCNGACEATPQPLDPYPFEGLDPRTQGQGLPTGSYNDPNFTDSPLSNTANRILSFVNGAGRFDGNNTVLAWPPVDPAALSITVTPTTVLSCSVSNSGGGVTNLAPRITSEPPTSAVAGQPFSTLVTAADPNGLGDALSFSLLTAPAGMTIDSMTGTLQWTPGTDQVGSQNVQVQVTDLGGLSDTQSFSLQVSSLPPPTITSTALTSAVAGTAYAYQLSFTAAGTPTFTLDAAPPGMTVSSSGRIAWAAPLGGTYPITVRLRDPQGASVTQTYTLSVDAIAITRAEFRSGKGEWRVDGTGSLPGNTVTVHLGSQTGPIVGTTQVDPLGTGTWALRLTNSSTSPSGVSQVTVVSARGATAVLGLTVRN